MKYLFLSIVSFVFLMTSCVSSKVHQDLQSRYEILNSENENIRLKNQDYEVEIKETKALLNKANKTLIKMEKDTIDLGYDLRKMRKNYSDLNKQYEFLLNNNSTLLADNARQNKQLLERLEDLQGDLDAKEDSLNLEQAKLIAYQKELFAKNTRLIQLENIISKQDSTMSYVYNKLSKALMGFEGKGLTIQQKDGKVYVSMENSLLFGSGSWTVSSKGTVALNNLASVLGENNEINVLVEGHTDSDAYYGKSQIKDNWDLSVMRSTSVVKILTANPNVRKSRITAGGKGEFMPISDNESIEGKSKNRRIEIILTPDLEGLFDMVK